MNLRVQLPAFDDTRPLTSELLRQIESRPGVARFLEAVIAGDGPQIRAQTDFCAEIIEKCILCGDWCGRVLQLRQHLGQEHAPMMPLVIYKASQMHVGLSSPCGFSGRRHALLPGASSSCCAVG
eukprot:Skav213925  [mRNA]  locus=scaffold2079:35775:36146:+ [translate_table: standard]